MPKFTLLKEGANQALLLSAQSKVKEFIMKMMNEQDYVEVDGIYSFSFGSINVEIRVVPWHSEDVLVSVYSYVAEEINLTTELAEEILRLNASTPFGSFGLTFDNAVIYSHSVAGANLDYNEFLAAVQTVATVADDYDERIKELGMRLPS